MKKIYLIIILTLFMFPLTIRASTNTCTRDENNLNIPDKIKYNTNMKHNILTTPCVDATEKVYDFADLLTDYEEQSLYEIITEFINHTNLDFAIVTINENPKNSPQQYADDFYDYNAFTPDGLVFLIDMSIREFYISTTGQAILYYDDYRINSLLDTSYNSMHIGDYQEAISLFIKQAQLYYDKGVVNAKYTITENGQIVRKTPWLILILISLIPTIAITLQLALRNKKVKLATNADKYLEEAKVNITKREDRLINSHTTSVYIPPASSSGSGSSGGSFHSGSSGTSHSGGGRRF